MPSYSTMPIPELLDATNTLYVNARDDAETVDGLADYGYTGPDDYDAGLALRQAVIDTAKEAGAEDLDKREATREVQKATATLYARATRHRDAARRAHPDGTEGYGALSLGGRTPRDRQKLTERARDFYATLDARPELHEPIRGLGADGVTAALALVKAVEDGSRDQARETSEARSASRDAQDAVDALRAHATEMGHAAEDAFADRPDLLEKLGL